MQDRRPPLQPLRPPQPPLPSLDRGTSPGVQAHPMQPTGPQRLDSLEAKLTMQRSMCHEVKTIKLTALLPCSIHSCLHLTSTAQISYELSLGQYRFSPICSECMKKPRP